MWRFSITLVHLSMSERMQRVHFLGRRTFGVDAEIERALFQIGIGQNFAQCALNFSMIGATRRPARRVRSTTSR